jgi:methyl-accepting chemotaxis protein
MKIGGRLGIAFGSVVLLMVVVGVISINRLVYLDDEITLLATDKYPKTILLNDIKNNLNLVARALRNIIITKDVDEITKEKKRITECREIIGKRIDELGKVVHSDTGKGHLKAVVDARQVYVESLKSMLALIESGDKEKATSELLTGMRKSQTAYFEALDKMIEFQSKEVERIAKTADHAATTAKTVIIVLLCIAVLLSAILAYFIVRSITRPIAEMVASNERLANGDLTVTISSSGKDEVGQLAESSRKMVDNLRDLLRNVAETSEQVASAASQLQSTAEQIATGAEQVACQTGTVANASEEMAATSTDIARNCSMAVDSSRQTSEAATQGGAIVQETIAGMTKISERVKLTASTVESLGMRSEQIGQIIGTIEDIADQTNLLALNAAIEAARAGEQGRGFAVVADEVRALAERTTRATKEIGAMIKAIQSETKAAVKAMEEGVGEVEKGTESSQRSGQALEDILSQISDMTMQINQIATAAEEQTATTSEITTNIQQVTAVVHQTARGASETATAASQLSSNAHILQQLVGRFRL